MSYCASCAEECGHGYSVPVAARVPVAGSTITLALCASCAEGWEDAGTKPHELEARGWQTCCDGKLRDPEGNEYGDTLHAIQVQTVREIAFGQYLPEPGVDPAV